MLLRCTMNMHNDQPLKGARILIAEDDAFIALDIFDLLQDAGAEFLAPAASLGAALAIAKTASLTCAVLDVNLRRQLVFPAAQVLKERGVKIVFNTACSELERLRQDWPDAQVLSKPAPPHLLLRSVCIACCSAGLPACHYCL